MGCLPELGVDVDGEEAEEFRPVGIGVDRHEEFEDFRSWGSPAVDYYVIHGFLD